MNKRHVQHLYFRSGFGIDYKTLNHLHSKTKAKVVKHLFASSTVAKRIEMNLSDVKQFLTLTRAELKENPKKVIKFQKENRQKIKELNALWIDRLRSTDADLSEKMTLFWANVFVCKDNNIFHILRYNNTLRQNALGNFRTFVKAIAKEAAMSKYLNNRQNRKQKPNENFARELMELFTLGEGYYTEQDIKEAARAFTGWSFKKNGDYFLRKRQHDYGEKTFLGKTGYFNGDDIIDIILEQKQCARFICTKIYRYFVNPEVKSSLIEELTDLFYRDYDIKTLMHHIFSSDWFYNEENIGAKIKSPIELLVGIQRIVPFQFIKQQRLLYIQKIMGQILLNPPNVAGWKQDRNWIDSNTLMFRLKLASIVLNDAVINIDTKGEFEDAFENYYNNVKNRNRYLKVERDWGNFNKNYKQLDAQTLKSLLIISKIDKDTDAFLNELSNKDPKEYLIQLMSIPEYQLC